MMAASKGEKRLQPTMEAQKLLRIKVNRVAIHQTLKVEHVLDYLIEQKVLDKNDENKINKSGFHPYDRTKTFVTLLIGKKKNKNWYEHFVNALKNPGTYDSEVKKKYQILVEFLDNTIITKTDPPKIAEKSKMLIPHYDPLPPIPAPSETPGSRGFGSRVGSRVTFNLGMTPDEEDERYLAEDLENVKHRKNGRESEDGKGPNDYRITEEVNKGVDGLEDIMKIAGEIPVPVNHFKALMASKDPVDAKQLTLEIKVMERTKGLVELYRKAAMGQLPDDTVFFREPAVLQVIEDEQNHHMYFKYLMPILALKRVNILCDIIDSFLQYVRRIEKADNESERNELIYTGFALSDFLMGLGKLYQAERVIYCLILYLETNPVLESWIGIWEAHIKIMSIRNENLDFAGAEASRWTATAMANRIKLMSFGQDLLDEGDMFMEMSIMMRERGSLGPALAWAQDALKEVEKENQEGIINSLCVAMHGYLGRDNFKQANKCAIYAVQQARKLFGPRHPLYVKALLHYTHFSIACAGGEGSVQLAKKTLSIALAVYGGPSLQVAAAHQSLALAMIENKDPEANDTKEALNHARSALKMVRDLTHGDHPRLALCQLIVGRTILANYHLSEDKDDTSDLLHTAKFEMTAALGSFKSSRGFFSHYTVIATQLLARILDAIGEKEKAFSLHSEAYQLCLLSVDPRSLLSWRIKLDTAKAWFQHRYWDDGISLMDSVFKSIDTKGARLKWVEEGYHDLIEILHREGEPQEAEKYREWLNQWLQHTTELETMPWEQLNSGSQAFEEFRNGIDGWTTMFSGKGRKGLLKKIKAYVDSRNLR